MEKDLNSGLRFGILFHDVSRLRRIVVDRALKPLGITRSQWWVLAFLSRHDGMTQTSLANDLDLTKVAIGGLLDRMEASGYVERRSEPSDGRARRVYLTEAGKELVSPTRANVEAVEVGILAKIPVADLDHAAETLVALKATLLEMVEADDADDDRADVNIMELGDK